MGRARGGWVLAAVASAWTVGDGAAASTPTPAKVRAALRASLPAGVGVYHIRVGPGSGERKNPHAGEHYTGSAVNIRNRVLDSHHKTAAKLLGYGDARVLYWRLDPHGQPVHRVCDCVTYWEQRVYEHIDGPLGPDGQPAAAKKSHNRARALPDAQMNALAAVCEKMKLVGPTLAYPAPGQPTAEEQTPPPPFEPRPAGPARLRVRPRIEEPMLSTLQSSLPQTYGVYWLGAPCERPRHVYVGSADDVRSRLLYQDHPKARLLLEAPRTAVGTWALDLSRAELPPGRDPGEVCACQTFAEQVVMDRVLGADPDWAPEKMKALVPGQRVVNSARAMSKARMADPDMQAMCRPVLGALELRWPVDACPPQAPPSRPPAQSGP